MQEHFRSSSDAEISNTAKTTARARIDRRQYQGTVHNKDMSVANDSGSRISMVKKSAEDRWGQPITLGRLAPRRISMAGSLESADLDSLIPQRRKSPAQSHGNSGSLD